MNMILKTQLYCMGRAAKGKEGLHAEDELTEGDGSYELLGD